MNTIVNWVIGIFIIWFVLSTFGGFGKYEGRSAEDWFNQYDESSGQNEELQTQVENLKSALQEANDNIENANSEIESAKGYSGESYDEMESALDSLNTINTVDEP